MNEGIRIAATWCVAGWIASLTAVAAPSTLAGDDRSVTAGASGSSASVAAPQSGAVAVVYDLGSMAPRVHVDTRYELVTPLLARPDDDAAGELDSESAADTFARVLSFLFERELDGPGRELRIEQDGRLRIVAPTAVHQEVARVLAFLEGVFRREVEVRIDLVEAPAQSAPLGGVVPLAEADKLLAGGTARSFTMRAPVGRVAALDATRVKRFVGGYEVEVAEMAVQFAPRVDALRTGLHCSVRAAAVSGGVQIALSSSSSQLVSMRPRRWRLGGTLGSETSPSTAVEEVEVELPTVLACAGAFNLFVPDGHAAVLDAGAAVQSGTRRELMVVRCSPSGAPPVFALDVPSAGARIEIVDASWHTPPRAEVESESGGFDFVGDARRLEWTHGGERSIAALLAPPVLTDLHERLMDGAPEMSTLGPWIVSLRKGGGGSPLDFSSPALSPSAAPATARLAWKLVRVGAGGPPLLVGAAPLLIGETSAWMVGGETRISAYANVEIASKLGTIYPQLESSLDGALFWARPSRAVDGGLTCEFAFAAHVQSGPLSEVQVGAPLTVTVDRGDWDVLALNETLRAPAGGAPRKFVFRGGGGLELELELR